ncbi:MAG: UDP-N-acetylmuramoyl-L-alanyl-D-glutamate--2,6-diaminopimelate ligase [Erysipelotrichales bacterium]|nr:UDP-N-acetylmuramoyl-L-alanyl-D-glutamate--2,6-diaminopimelate ligase [Erysipelotrichales bacterium]
MRLKDFYPEINEDKEVSNIVSNSTKDLKDVIFVCRKGKKFDSHDFIDKIKDKVAFIVSEKPLSSDIPHIVVSDASFELARLLMIMYGDKIRNMKLIGITGTDGKTTTASIAYHVLKSFGAAYLGTNGLFYNEQEININNTTPGINDMYDYLLELKQEKINYLSMEVSSHGIKQNRVRFLPFKYKVFTNLSHEHLDEFGDMETYYQAKKALFTDENHQAISIINIDDSYGFRLFNELKTPKISFGKNIRADFQITNLITFPDYSKFSFIYREHHLHEMKISLPCEYNVYNSIPAIIIAINEFMSLKKIAQELAEIPQIKGRFERFKVKDFSVIIDFAHTPNSLKNLLENISKMNYNKIILVIGAAGNKDKTKRAEMGKVASLLADYVFFTEEDSESEDTKTIIDMLTSNIEKNNYTIEFDRKKAINQALNRAETNDVVVITGKGLENTLKKKDGIVSHSDLDIILNHK